MPLTKRYVLKIMKKKLNYDYCQAAPVLEWMSQKWALVVMLRIEEYEKESIRFSELFRTFPQVSEKVLASTLDYLLQEGLVTRERFEEVPPREGTEKVPFFYNQNGKCLRFVTSLSANRLK